MPGPGIATPWKSLAVIIESFRRFGALHPSKRLWLTEWASAEDPQDPSRKPKWIADAQALFKQPGYAESTASRVRLHRLDVSELQLARRFVGRDPRCDAHNGR